MSRPATARDSSVSPTAQHDTGHPWLVRVLGRDRLLDPPSRHYLGRVDRVVIGRGNGRSVVRQTDDRVRRLELRLPDPRISEVHAHLRNAYGRWSIEDAGSTNGTYLNGARIRSAVLADGDLIETGHTFFLFRAQLRGDAEAARLSDAGPFRLPAPAPSLATVLPDFAELLRTLERLAPSTVPVILSGDSGTGKEVAARALHVLSRRTGPYVALNCAALHDGTLEAQLFGYRRGAFTDAKEDRTGLLVRADGGTLLLDELGDMSAAGQAKLLRVLQEKEVLPLGAARPVPVDLRVVVATHRHLDELVAAGQFRADLYARVAGYTLTLPSLSRRREDLGLLIAALLERLVPERASQVRFERDAARALLRYTWPLNVRELERTLAAALVLAGDGAIRLAHLGAALGRHDSPAAPAPVPPVLTAADELLRRRLDELLAQHQGNVAAVARALDKEPRQVRRWLKRFALAPERFRER